MVKRRTCLLVLLFGFMLTMLSAGHSETVVVKLERIGDRWVAWFPHQTNGIWTIQASPTGKADDWFTPPSYFDDGVRVQAPVPNVSVMFFRARRVR